MEVVVLPVNLLTVATVVAVTVPGRRRVALGLLDARRQRVGAMGTHLTAMVAPGPLATGMSQPTRPTAGYWLQRSWLRMSPLSSQLKLLLLETTTSARSSGRD
jgi:hypothetical protein